MRAHLAIAAAALALASAVHAETVIRTYPRLTLSAVGGQASLRTTWEAGEVRYRVRIRNGPAKLERYEWTLILSSEPFQLASQRLAFQGIDARGTFPMSSQDYLRIDKWQLVVRPR